MSNYIFFLSDIKLKTFPSLVKEEADKLEGLITLQEASFTLKIMQNGRSPGTVCLDFRFWMIGFFQIVLETTEWLCG